MNRKIIAYLFGKILAKGDLVGAKNGIMVFKQTCKDGMITLKSFRKFKPFRLVTQKDIVDMTDGIHIYNNAKQVLTEVTDFVNKTKTKIVSTKFHSNPISDANLGNVSQKYFVSDVQYVKTLPNCKQNKCRVINRLNNINLYKEEANGKKIVTSYNKTPEGHIGAVNYKIPYSQKTTPSRHLAV